MLKRNNCVLRVALDLEVSSKRRQGRPKKTRKQQVEEEAKVDFKMDAMNQTTWRYGERRIAEGMG